MGGHGGLNILPQKSWNVYNFENRERVKIDEEAAAREEDLRQQQARQREAEFRWEKLREAADARKASAGNLIKSSADGDNARGDADREVAVVAGEGIRVASSIELEEPRHINLFGGCVVAVDGIRVTSGEESKESRHINLFDGWDGFEGDFRGTVGSKDEVEGTEGRRKDKGSWRANVDQDAVRRMRRQVKDRAKDASRNGMEVEDEHYKLGYGCLGKDKKRPWYAVSKSSIMEESTDEVNEGCVSETVGTKAEQRKKTLDELREERLKREQKERERAHTLLFSKAGGSSGGPAAARKRATYYNSSFGNARYRPPNR